MLRSARQPGAFRRFGVRLKWRAVWSLAAFGFGFGAAFWYARYVFTWLLAPAAGQLSPFEGGLPVFSAPQDMFGVTIWMSIRAGIIVALPVLLIGAYTLVSPVLSRSQRWMLRIFLPAPFVLFLGGAAFVYYVMLPVGLRFLLNFGDGVAVPLITLRQYIDLLTALMLALGIVFQLPLGMFLLSKMGFIPYPKFKSVRKFVPFIAVILGIILTPGTDPVNAAIVAAPITVLYEFGLFLSWAAKPEDGNYLFLRSAGRAIRWAYRKAKAVALSPWTGARWAYRKVLRR